MIEPDLPKYQWGQRVKAAIFLTNDDSLPNAPADGLLVSAGRIGEICASRSPHHCQPAHRSR